MQNGHEIAVEGEDEQDPSLNPNSMQNVDLNITKDEEAERLADASTIEIEVKTGTPAKHLKHPPYHIKSCFEFEPLQPYDDTVLERSL